MIELEQGEKTMKKIILTVMVMMLGMVAFAGEKDDALTFFQNFVSASNSYSPAILNMYSENARIIRQVVKPNGQLVNAYFSSNDYKKQMKISEKVAKLRHYKNYYSNINVTKVSNGYRIDAMRKPSLSSYKLKTSMVVQKHNGKWLIVEEMMQTKEQIFLKYAK